MAEDRARVQTDIIKESTGLMYDVHRISQSPKCGANGGMESNRGEVKKITPGKDSQKS